MADTSQDKAHPSGWTVDTIKEYFTERLRAIERLIDDSEKARNTALAAQKEAINKAEASQLLYNQGHNDLSRKMEAQYSQMVPISEARLKWSAVDKDVAEIRNEIVGLREQFPKEITALRIELMKLISDLRESRSEGGGRDIARRDYTERREWSTGTIITVVFGSLAVIFSLVDIFRLKP